MVLHTGTVRKTLPSVYWSLILTPVPKMVALQALSEITTGGCASFSAANEAMAESASAFSTHEREKSGRARGRRLRRRATRGMKPQFRGQASDFVNFH